MGNEQLEIRPVCPAALDLIKSFEGLKLKAYLCPAKVWTIGYGHTGADVYKGLIITLERADELLLADLEKFSRGVQRVVPSSVNDNQFGALVSFAYNVGLGALTTSTLLRKLKEGDIKAAANQFDKWNRGGGKILPGLARRRKAEKELFLTAQA